MTTSLTRTLVAATFIALSVAACAGAAPQWTFAPVQAPDGTGEPAASGEPGQSAAPAPNGLPEASPAASAPAATGEPAGSPSPAATAAPAGSPAPGGSAAPDGEARVVELQATNTLQFTTPDGERVTDIPVTPGETVVFRVDNVAGFDHNFLIGTDQELSVPNASGLPGIPTWSSGVQEFEWAVPDDVSGLKFGCVLPGHYASMQGTFSVAS
jgi:hypothetical protein